MSSKFSVPIVLLVCTGNVCRSPMAEALMLHHIGRLKLAATVISRGLAAPVGRPPHPHALNVAHKMGVPLAVEKRAAAITSADMAMASVIFVMDSEHRREVHERFPTSAGKTFLLGQWQGQEIADPINEPYDAFEAAWQQCDIGAQEWIKRLCDAGMLHSLENQ